MSVPAFIYARFSTAEQSKGHSLERQLIAGRAYVLSQGWLYDRDRELTDEGKSAFHGINRAEGSALYEFERKAREGHFANGAALAVENIDRLTRQGWEEATDILRQLTSSGVTVAFWQANEVFNAGERIDLARVIMLAVKSELALEESAKKSKRQKASWDARIKAAQESGANTKGPIPSWLERDHKTKAPRPVEHRATILNQIYSRYIEGEGIPKLVHWLNSSGEPTWGRGKHGNKTWNASTLHKLLTTRSVLGEYQPKERYVSGTKRKLKGQPIADYYPQVISTEKYNRAQAVRKTKTGWGGKTTPTFRNLFTGIARCGECGGRMHSTYTTKGRSYLFCYDRNRGTGCDNGKHIRYQLLESGVMAMLPRVFERAFARQKAHPASALAEQAAELERNLEHKKQSLVLVIENLGQTVSKSLAQKAADLEEEIEQESTALGAMRRNVAAEMGKPLPKDEVEEVERLYKHMNEGSEDEQQAKRARVNMVLRGLVTAMDCKADGTTMLVAADSLGLTFNAAGECVDVSVLEARYEGPDGEANWQPEAARA